MTRYEDKSDVEYFDSEFTQIDRILLHRQRTGVQSDGTMQLEGKEFFVKWKGLRLV